LKIKITSLGFPFVDTSQWGGDQRPKGVNPVLRSKEYSKAKLVWTNKEMKKLGNERSE